MNSTIELARLIQQDRETQIRSDRLASFAARVRACCELTTFDRMVRAPRGNPAAC